MTELKRRRIEADMTQLELSVYSGVKLRVLQDYEQGRRDLAQASAETVLKLARVLKCTIEDLIS